MNLIYSHPKSSSMNWGHMANHPFWWIVSKNSNSVKPLKTKSNETFCSCSHILSRIGRQVNLPTDCFKALKWVYPLQLIMHKTIWHRKLALTMLHVTHPVPAYTVHKSTWHPCHSGLLYVKPGDQGDYPLCCWTLWEWRWAVCCEDLILASAE